MYGRMYGIGTAATPLPLRLARPILPNSIASLGERIHHCPDGATLPTHLLRVEGFQPNDCGDVNLSESRNIVGCG